MRVKKRTPRGSRSSPKKHQGATARGPKKCHRPLWSRCLPYAPTGKTSRNYLGFYRSEDIIASEIDRIAAEYQGANQRVSAL
jgi:hypothetical protein